MTPTKGKSGSPDDELQRASRQIAARLRALGIPLNGSEPVADLVAIEEAIERFEQAVETHGGDLMVDEGPPGKAPQPDDSHFSLPIRKGNETVAAYLERLARATDVVRHHRKID